MSSPGSRRTPLVVLGVAGLVLGLSFIGFQTSDGAVKERERQARLAEADTPGAAGGSAARAIPEVRIVQPRGGDGEQTDWIELSGLLEPVRATWVAAERAGQVVKVATPEHASVAADALLVQLDSALARADVIRAEANHRLAELALARQEELGQRSVASEAERDRAKAEERSAYAALLEARKRLDQTRIRAPFAGVVNRLDLDPGAYVAPGTPIAEILDVSTLELEVEVSDRQIGAISVGDEARIRIDSLGNTQRTATIVRVARAPDSETQRYPVVVALPNEDGHVLPGMLARAELAIGRGPALRIPSSAVVREFEIDYAVVVAPGRDGDGGIARRVRIGTRPVPFRPDWTEVTAGLDASSWIVSRGGAAIGDGAPVRIVDRGGAGP